MKSKKQRNPNSNGKESQPSNLAAPLPKQFELLYRTCDKLPSSQQYQSVFFLKRKKIPAEQCTNSQEKKTQKKKSCGKKKKIEEKLIVDQVCCGSQKKGESLAATKSTMPSSTMGLFKKSTFADAFKQKIDLGKSSIKRVNNLSNSNSSRYLASKYMEREEKTGNRKANTRSPGKTVPSQAHPQTSIKSLDNQNSNTKSASKINKKGNASKGNEKEGKGVKRKRELRVEKQAEVKKDDSQDQYVFVDGEYLQMEDPQSCQALTQKMISVYRSEKEARENNQFIEGFTKLSINLDKIKGKQAVIPEFSEPQADEESISQSEKAEAEKDVLRKIVLIQRWWRSCLEYRAIEQCNNIKHFPSNAQSQRSIEENQPIEQAKQQLIAKQVSGKNLVQFMEMREKLIQSHIQSEKEILSRMLELQKIDGDQYANSLVEIEASYQAEILEISRFKQKVAAQTQRMEELKMKLKEKTQIMDKLQKLPASVILEHFIQKPPKGEEAPLSIQSLPSSRRKSTGYHYSQLSQGSQEDKKAVSYRKNKPETQMTSPMDMAQKEEFTNSEEEAEEEDGDVNEEDCCKLEHILEGAIDRQTAQTEIEKRYASQLGMGFQHSGINRRSIATSVLAVHNFVMNFLKFYQYFYKDEFLKLINLPYGHNQRTRMKLHQDYTADSWAFDKAGEDEELFFKVDSIIGQEILEDFHEHNYQLAEDADDATRAIVYFEKVHQKAIIDCFNECLNCFRPYYFINGAPYLWNYSEKALTFYYIAQENVQEVFEKTQYKVLKTASSLCGVLAEPLMATPDIKKEMSLEEKMAKYRESVDPLLVENREEKLSKIQKQEVEQFNFQWEYFQEEKTSVMFSLAQQIYEHLLLEILDIKPLGVMTQVQIPNGSQDSRKDTQSAMSSQFLECHSNQQSKQDSQQSEHSQEGQEQDSQKQEEEEPKEEQEQESGREEEEWRKEA